VEAPPKNLTYNITGQHFSVQLNCSTLVKDASIVIHSPLSDIGRMLTSNNGRMSILSKDSASIIAEIASLLTALCGVQLDLIQNNITVHHAIGVIGNIVQLFDNSVPDPEPQTLTRGNGFG
jgi:hypothetical protein